MTALRTETWKGLWTKFKEGMYVLVKSPAFYVYLLAVAVYLPYFLPNLSEIAPWDETYYLLSGKNLIAGQIPALGGSPMSAIFYALCYLPFRNSPYWLVHANSLGRFLLFSGLFLGIWQVGKALKKYFNPLILFGFLFLSPILTQTYEYPADALFITISALAFSHAVRFLETKQCKHLVWASFCLGAGMLTRGDALFISLPFFILMVVASWKQHKWWRLIITAVLPFLAVTVGYLLVRGLITGDFNTGMAEYSYTVFEQGQEADLPGGDQRFGNPTESYYIARERFGTPEENDYSVFKAIMRNPTAYLSRVKGVLSWVPGLYLNAYYRRYTPLITLLAVRGLIALLRKKKNSLAILHLIWILPIGAGILRTLYRQAYFQMFLFVIFSLAALGLKALLDNLRKGWEVLAWAGALIGMLVLASLKGEAGIQFAMMIYLGWLVLSLLLAKKARELPNWQSMAMLLLLAVGFMLKVDYLIYEPRVLGEDYREQASLVLREVTDPNSQVLTGTPSVVFMAEREVANISAADIPEFESSDEFIQWMAVQDFEAIYLDREAPGFFWDLIFELLGKALTQVWASDDGEAYIFLLN
jgi:hypothetical protein